MSFLGCGFGYKFCQVQKVKIYKRNKIKCEGECERSRRAYKRGERKYKGGTRVEIWIRQY